MVYAHSAPHQTPYMLTPLYYRILKKIKLRILCNSSLRVAMVCATAFCFNLAHAQHPPGTLDTPPNAAPNNKPTCEAPSPHALDHALDDDDDAPEPKQDKACAPHIRLRALLALRCKTTKDALCAQLTQRKRRLSKAERTELRHALREYARQAGIHKRKQKP